MRKTLGGALAVVAALLLFGCRTLRPTPSLGSPRECPAGTVRVCTGACAPASSEGGPCNLDECAPGAEVCGPSLACVPGRGLPAMGTCQAASSLFCDPNVAAGAPGNRCADPNVCVRASVSGQDVGRTACFGSSLFRLAGGAPAAGVCRSPGHDGDPCDSTWGEARAANGTADLLCNPCAPGLLCARGICRRACADRSDCPPDVRGNTEQSFDYRCSPSGNLSLCTTCAPVGGLCPPSPWPQSARTPAKTAASGPCCTPGAVCERTCCMPEGLSCGSSLDCCAGTMCRDRRCVACGVLEGVCCDSGPQARFGNPACLAAGNRCLGGICRDCGGDGQRLCADGSCFGDAHPDWNSAARANLCSSRCGRFFQHACRFRYPVSGGLSSRYSCFDGAELFAQGSSDPAACLCVPSSSRQALQPDVSDDSGLCISTRPPERMSDPPDGP